MLTTTEETLTNEDPFISAGGWFLNTFYSMIYLNMDFGRTAYTYIITNKSHSVLYTGFTTNLVLRMYQHKTKYYQHSFSARYNVNKLVYYSVFESADEAHEFERHIKSKSRRYKVELINQLNPFWNDLTIPDSFDTMW